MPARSLKNRLGDSSTSTIDRRASKRSLWLVVKRGQSCAPGMMSASSANIWQPLHTPRPKVSWRAKKALNWSANTSLNVMLRAQPMPAPKVSP